MAMMSYLHETPFDVLPNSQIILLSENGLHVRCEQLCVPLLQRSKGITLMMGAEVRFLPATTCAEQHRCSAHVARQATKNTYEGDSHVIPCFLSHGIGSALPNILPKT